MTGFPIIQYWHEDEPPAYLSELFASFDERNPGSEHLVFSAASAEELIATHYGARAVAAFRACSLPAMQADYFRYCAVLALGGVYADADCRCLRSLSDLVDGPAGGVLHGRPWPLAGGLADLLAWPYPAGSFGTVVNGLFGFARQGHPLLELAVELATTNIENRLGEGAVGVWLAAGPGVFTALYLLDELGSIDALDAYAAKSVLAPALPLLRRVAGDRSAVSRAFDGVEIRPISAAYELVAETMKPAGQREPHWVQSRGDIYR